MLEEWLYWGNWRCCLGANVVLFGMERVDLEGKPCEEADEICRDVVLFWRGLWFNFW